MAIFFKGGYVRHNHRAEWGIGTVQSVDKYGVIKVIFQGTQELSIAKGAKYLIKVDENGNRID
jgi:hypothetical protein